MHVHDCSHDVADVLRIQDTLLPPEEDVQQIHFITDFALCGCGTVNSI